MYVCTQSSRNSSVGVFSMISVARCGAAPPRPSALRGAPERHSARRKAVWPAPLLWAHHGGRGAASLEPNARTPEGEGGWKDGREAELRRRRRRSEEGGGGGRSISFGGVIGSFCTRRPAAREEEEEERERRRDPLAASVRAPTRRSSPPLASAAPWGRISLSKHS